MRRRAVLSPRALLLLAFCWAAPPTRADGNVGCLFSEPLCTEKVEWCYDDYAFGKCLQVYGNVEEEDLARHELTTDELRAFERELQRLLQLGYRWSHAYTQCVLQAMLYSAKSRVNYEPTLCDHLADQDLTAALGAFEADEEVDPQSVAFVRYTPNNEEDQSDFADEIYFPPNEREYLANIPIIPDVEMPIRDDDTSEYDGWSQNEKRSFNRDNGISRRSTVSHQIQPGDEIQSFSRIYNTPGNFREGHETRDLNMEKFGHSYPADDEYQPEDIPHRLSDKEQISLGYLSSLPFTSDDIMYLMQPENEEQLRAILPRYIESPENLAYPEIGFVHTGAKDPINAWLENQNIDELRAALKELKEPYKQNVDPYYVSTSEFLTKNRLKSDRFSQQYNTPARFRQGYESRDGLLDREEEPGPEMPEPRIYIDEDEQQDHFREESGSGEHDGRSDALRELEFLDANGLNQNDAPPYEEMYNGRPEVEEEATEEGAQPALLARLLNIWRSGLPGSRGPGTGTGTGTGVFTEGGVVYTGNSSPPSDAEKGPNPSLLSPELGALLADYEWGFRRRERLDVKKPGPPFDVKNQHFHSAENQTKPPEAAVVAPLMVKKELHDEEEKVSSVDHNHDPRFNVDSSYAYVGLKDSIRTWKEGAQVVRTIGELLHLEPSAFSYPRVDRNEVTFRVGPNSKSLNASEVSRRIDDIKDELKKELGVEVTSAGIGDKVKNAKYPSVRLKSSESWEAGWGGIGLRPGMGGGLMAGILGGGAAALIAALALLLLQYQRGLRRDKIRDISRGDTEASQDYQDLCRARMSGKWATPGPGDKGAPEKQESTGQRITSLSRESDGNSPSTRSSTSSWSEEPALTNMDISTGHMVLTYMEDHLKNKDRLEQEWQALCAYEAEPSAAAAAQAPDNAPKNRAPGVLPYDHARLVLNDVTNLASSDYINASTITDHDPRNPAYIAAQGPLAHTAPDFWQMVWEQGSVVMVMLTRLTEGGMAMCHRYWPEEGSDLYHIYEVHLVSEHIWCDDYLVRSFYLKNLKTGETRTVTQFHFLSWPDRGVPSSTKALLEFRRKVNKSYRGRSCPIVVHCSDGAGRTGTYCLIDMVLNRMAKGAKEIDIAATLEHIRDQRPHMVTTKQQFEFVLMAVAEEVHAILKALPAQLQQQHEKREKELAAEKEKQDKQEKPQK